MNETKQVRGGVRCSPVAQLGEEEVQRKISSQPGEAAQNWEPWQGGERDPRFGLRDCPTEDQEAYDRHNNEHEQERQRDDGGQRGDETREHDGMKTKADRPTFIRSRDLGDVRSQVHVCVCVCFCCVFILVSQP